MLSFLLIWTANVFLFANCLIHYRQHKHLNLVRVTLKTGSACGSFVTVLGFFLALEEQLNAIILMASGKSLLTLPTHILMECFGCVQKTHSKTMRK